MMFIAYSLIVAFGLMCLHGPTVRLGILIGLIIGIGIGLQIKTMQIKKSFTGQVDDEHH